MSKKEENVRFFNYGRDKPEGEKTKSKKRNSKERDESLIKTSRAHCSRSVGVTSAIEDCAALTISISIQRLFAHLGKKGGGTDSRVAEQKRYMEIQV